jgi:hypothetical protein
VRFMACFLILKIYNCHDQVPDPYDVNYLKFITYKIVCHRCMPKLLSCSILLDIAHISSCAFTSFVLETVHFVIVTKNRASESLHDGIELQLFYHPSKKKFWTD